ncbi:MAG: PAS domain-containing protein [Gemmatirosa sp.]
MYSSVAAALRVDAAVLDVVLKQLPSGVLVVDRDGRVAYANDAARALGLADGEALRWTITRTLLTGDGVRGEALVLPAEGVTARRLSVDVVPARSAGGAHAAVITVADVTARTRAAEWEPLIESLMNL